MSTSHEPAYSEDGMPKERYRLYHAREGQGGGHGADHDRRLGDRGARQPGRLRNLHAYRDEIVPWLAELADACHEHDCKVMIQLTHLGRRTGWNKADWLPVLSASPVREPAHRTFPKQAEDWDLDRIVADYASAAARMQAAGLDGIEFEAYGHLLDGFWSPATNHRDDDYGGSLDNRLRFTWRVIDAVRAAVGPDFIVGIRMVRRRGSEKGLSKSGRRDRAASRGVPKIRFPQHHPRFDRDRCGVDQGDPDHRHALIAASRFCRRGEGGDQISGLPRCAHFGRRDSQACDRHRQARHGRHDARPPRRSAYRQEGDGGPRASDPALRRRHLLPRPYL